MYRSAAKTEDHKTWKNLGVGWEMCNGHFMSGNLLCQVTEPKNAIFLTTAYS